MGLTLRLVIASVFTGRAEARLPSITVLEGGPPPLPPTPHPTPRRESAADCGCGSSSMQFQSGVKREANKPGCVVFLSVKRLAEESVGGAPVNHLPSSAVPEEIGATVENK